MIFAAKALSSGKRQFLRLTFSETDADSDGREDEAEGGDDNEEDTADAETHEDVVDVAPAVFVRSGAGMILRQSRHGISGVWDEFFLTKELSIPGSSCDT